MKKLMTVLLCICMVLAMIPAAALQYEGVQYRVGDTFTLGSYPQSKVTDANTITALEAVDKTWKSYGYYSRTDTPTEFGFEVDGSMTASDFMQYADFTCSGVKYRAVKFSQYRPVNTGYLPSADASYQDDNGYEINTIYYFRYDSLTWKVLDRYAGLVMCTNVIDAQAFQNFAYGIDGICYNSKDCTEYANDWETSTLRKWLNNDFYNTAFTEEEKSKIGITNVEDAYDNIFILSKTQAENSTYGFKNDSSRQLGLTEYAKCQGLYTDTSAPYWRLRTASADSYGRGTWVVDSIGAITESADSNVIIPGVVPAFKLNMNVTFTLGSYPQSKVTDADTITALDDVEKTWISYGYYAGTGTFEETDSDIDGSMTASDYMQYADFTCSGIKYRAVKFSQYRPMSTGYLPSEDNSLQDNYGYEVNTIYYFRYDPLTWKVLDSDTGLAVCTNVIDAQAFQNFVYKSNDICYNSMDCTEYANDWETSTLRKWLNNDFYNTAFTEEEKREIGIANLGDTCDTIFVLSKADAENSAYGFTTNESRKLETTEYAKCQGLDMSDSHEASPWWLRTAGTEDGLCTSQVDPFGEIGGGVSNSIYHGGVVPAFKLNTGDPVEISVAFDTNGGKWAYGYTAPTSYSYYTVDKTDEALVLPTAENIIKSGCTLSGWVRTALSETSVLYTAQWGASPWAEYKTGDTFTFGSYPRSKVTDSDTITALGSIEKTWKYDSEHEDWYDDITYNGVKYRAFRASDYIDECYYKFEPLTWKMLDPEEGYAICTNVIDTYRYTAKLYSKANDGVYYSSEDYTHYASDWETSTVRQWLNEEFYNAAFTEEEKAQIGTAYLHNNSSKSDEYDGACTYDKLFFISYEDAANSSYGFNSDLNSSDVAKQFDETDFAVFRGLYYIIIPYESYTSLSSDAYYSWWLRTPVDSYRIAAITTYGNAAEKGVTDVRGGIVPAFKFYPDNPTEIKVTFDTAGHGNWAEGYTPPSSYMSDETLTLPTAENMADTGVTLVEWVLTEDTDTAKTYTAKWRWSVPEINIDYEDEYLRDFRTEAYIINGADVEIYGGYTAIKDEWYGTTISIVMKGIEGKKGIDGDKGTGDILDSEPQLLTIPERPAAPTDVGIENVTEKDAKDGKITGVSAEMEYMPEGGSWTDCTGDTITGLGAGTYTVRYKAVRRSSFASEPVTVTIAVEEEQPYTSSDALLVLKYCVDNSIGGVTLERHDLNGDGAITSSDALAILKLCANS